MIHTGPFGTVSDIIGLQYYRNYLNCVVNTLTLKHQDSECNQLVCLHSMFLDSYFVFKCYLVVKK